RQGDMRGDRALRLVDVAPQVAPGDVDEDVARERAVLVVDGWGRARDPDVGQLGERDLRAVAGGHGHALQAREVTPGVAHVADVEAAAPAAFARLRRGRAADRGLDDVLDVAHGEAVARDGVAADGEVQVGAARRPLGEGTARALDGGEHALDVARDAA